MKPVRIAFAPALFAALVAVTGCGSPPPSGAEKAQPEAKAEVPAAEPVKEEAPPLTGKHIVVMKTTKGTMKLELDADKAPKTVQNFLDYVDRKFYDHTIFHNAIKNYVIQAGGITMDLKRKLARDPIPNESDNGLKNVRGTIAMAHGEDPDSATVQFIINLRNNPRFNRDYPKGEGRAYCVFGKVIEGMDTALAIGSVKTRQKSTFKNLPAIPVFIRSMRRAS